MQQESNAPMISSTSWAILLPPLFNLVLTHDQAFLFFLGNEPWSLNIPTLIAQILQGLGSPYQPKISAQGVRSLLWDNR